MILTSKKEQLERIGMSVEPDQHSNAQKLDSLYQRQRKPSKPVEPAVGRRVDRFDTTASRSPTALHAAYMAALRGRHEF